MNRAVVFRSKDLHPDLLQFIFRDRVQVQHVVPKFDRWHFHDEEEVRFCREADSDHPPTFFFENGRKIVLGAGDLLVIPSKMVHKFKGFGTFDRFFRTKDGWQPTYVDEDTSERLQEEIQKGS